jgi:hypothetical protein
MCNESPPFNYQSSSERQSCESRDPVFSKISGCRIKSGMVNKDFQQLPLHGNLDAGMKFLFVAEHRSMF